MLCASAPFALAALALSPGCSSRPTASVDAAAAEADPLEAGRQRLAAYRLG